MDFGLSDSATLLQNTIDEITDEFDLKYWRRKDDVNEFLAEVWDEFTEADFSGMLALQEYGGSGYGMTEMVSASLKFGRQGGGVSGPNLLTSPVMGTTLLLEIGTEEQKERLLPQIVDGTFVAIDLTEPDAGTDTVCIKMRAK